MSRTLMTLATTFFVWPLTAFSADTFILDNHPAIQNPSMMKNAVQIQMTPRGQKIFSEGLMSILSNLGVVIDENYFPAFEYVSPESIKIDELAKKKPQEFGMLQKVRDFFKQYLQGLDFKDFKPSVKIGESDYTAKFTKLSLVTDEALMHKLGKQDGAVLALEVAISSLTGQTTAIYAKDLENPWMGEVGVTHPVVRIGSQENPIIARMPFYVRVDENGFLQFEALKIEENLDMVPIGVEFRKIILPEFEFKVVGQQQAFKIKLNETEFRKIVDEQLPQGIAMVKTYLREFLQNELPKTLNAKAQESLKTELEQIQALAAPGTKPNDTRPPFSLGLKLSQINIVKSQLEVKLSTFIEDTSLPSSPALGNNLMSKENPTFDHLAPKDYDLSVAVNLGVFNRAIYLAHARGNFNEVETCPGEPKIKLTNIPRLMVSSLKKVQPKGTPLFEAPLMIRIEAAAPVDDSVRKFLGIPFVAKEIRLKMNYHAIVKPAAVGSATLNIFLTKPDLSEQSLVIEDSSYAGLGALFKGTVRKKIIETLSKDSSCGNNEPLAQFKLIDSILGIPLEYAHVELDQKTGHFMLYMNYKK